MNEHFPFGLDDIKAWIIRRKDGTVVRFQVHSASDLQKDNSSRIINAPVTRTGIYLGSGYAGKVHYSAWCQHDPLLSNPPIFEKDGIALYIADAQGARKHAGAFDVAIDGGNALLVPGEYDLPILYGDPGLRNKLMRHIIAAPKVAKEEAAGVKIVKIRWADRCAPPVQPSFWVALLDQLRVLQAAKGDRLNVVTICQGGHGRSGSALAALIMALTDYTPLDALTHVRALHCARAIESKEQHQYLNDIGKFLKREPDAMDAEDVKSFKDRFLTMTSEYALPYKSRVSAGKGALVNEREATFS